MKIKRIDKKLVLNKKTISNLDMKRMKDVNGGVFTTHALCTVHAILCETGPCPAESEAGTCSC
jgi:hypothetical protein